MPERLQLSRKAGYRKPEGAVVVSRPSRYGNPFKPGEKFRFFENGQLVIGRVGPEREDAVKLFERFMAAYPDLRERAVRELGGKDLLCWCPLPEPGEIDWCHARVLIELANPEVSP